MKYFILIVCVFLEYVLAAKKNALPGLIIPFVALFYVAYAYYRGLDAGILLRSLMVSLVFVAVYATGRYQASMVAKFEKRKSDKK